MTARTAKQHHSGVDGYGTTTVARQPDDFDDIVGGLDDGDGGGNPRCAWDESVCQETVTHQITWGFYETATAEPTRHAQTFCPRHYAVELARFAEFHAPQCTVSIGDHLLDFGQV